MSDTATVETPAAAETNKKPVFKRKIGNISVAVFAEKKMNSQGEEFTSTGIALQRTWKGKDGFEHQTINLDRNDVIKITTALNEAYVATYDVIDV